MRASCCGKHRTLTSWYTTLHAGAHGCGKRPATCSSFDDSALSLWVGVSNALYCTKGVATTGEAALPTAAGCSSPTGQRSSRVPCWCERAIIHPSPPVTSSAIRTQPSRSSTTSTMLPCRFMPVTSRAPGKRRTFTIGKTTRHSLLFELSCCSSRIPDCWSLVSIHPAVRPHRCSNCSTSLTQPAYDWHASTTIPLAFTPSSSPFITGAFRTLTRSKTTL
mmetsp:Transcript_57382/g.150677  ORF Transcript_57382/g.150677 Transcript_57382/m.150677 type:complete len:220 (-) Transcript_57382:27-686(-)